MRPQKAKAIIQKSIDAWLSGDKQSLKKSLPALQKLYKKYSNEEQDFRDGYETYGYANSESNYNNMSYISDRWECAFRMRWIIDGITSSNL